MFSCSRVMVVGLFVFATQATCVYAGGFNKLVKVDDEASSVDANEAKPFEYAHVKGIQGVSINAGVLSKTAGIWKQLADGTLLWEYPYTSVSALSLDFGFTDFYLPPSASLSVRSVSQGDAVGPFSGKEYGSLGQFYTPIVSGSEAVIELRVAKAEVNQVNLNLDNVAEGFVDLFKQAEVSSMQKSESCHVDVACPVGLSVSPQARAVAMYTLRTPTGAGTCTGALVAKAVDVDNSKTNPIEADFLTANHCVSSPKEAASVVLYWGYQNSACRTPGSTASGTRLSLIPARYSASQPGGARLLANFAESDFALLRLNRPVPEAANAFWLGWDRRDQAARGAFVIHHPRGHEKRISMSYRDVVISGARELAATPVGDTHLRVPYWELGATESGSSGAPLMNDSGQVIGQLGGPAAPPGVSTDLRCPNRSQIRAFFGRLATSWVGAGTPDTRLSDWLDPDGTGVEFIAGMDAHREREGGWFGIHGRVVNVDAVCDWPAIPDDPSDTAECPVSFTETGGVAEVQFNIQGSGLNRSNLVASMRSPSGRIYEAPPAAFGVLSPTAAMFVARFGRIERSEGQWTLRVRARNPATTPGGNGTIDSIQFYPSLGASYWAWRLWP